MQENLKSITTIEELQQYVGKILLFYYGNENKLLYAWAKKITKIKDPNKKLYKEIREISRCPLRGVEVYGTNTVVMKSNNRPPELLLQKETMSNAQGFARELTLEEKFMYRRIIKQSPKNK